MSDAYHYGRRAMKENLYRIGDKVEPFGKVAAVQFRDGERSYLIEGDDGSVTLMPAELIERGRDDA